MVMYKKDIGHRIQTMRKQKGLTQIDLCGDESQLSVRQLSRIESGSSMISVPALYFICEQLGVTTDNILHGYDTSVPKVYLHWKNRVIQGLYVHEDVVCQKGLLLDKIYLQFYDELPINEKHVIDMLKKEYNMWVSKDVRDVELVLAKQIDVIAQKTYYTYTELILILLYFTRCIVHKDIGKYGIVLAYQVVQNIDYFDIEQLTVLERIVMQVLELIKPEQYPYFIDIYYKILSQTRHYTYQPLLYAFEATYEWFVEKDYIKSKKIFDNALQLAQLHKDEYLIERLVAIEKNLWT